ncbi:MAG: four helix bundle protein [Candidatus Peribacteria bacterium]|jgi:four helix bundle protein|nr:four helix bundle protein [Candidatus Peribacteria bacterium]
MTTYDNLPVYKASYDLLIKIFVAVKNFSKEYKYTLGDVIKKEAISLITNIYKANGKTERNKNIALAREKTELIRLYFRLCKDMKVISLNKYIEVSTVLEDISKQLTARDKSTKE